MLWQKDSLFSQTTRKYHTARLNAPNTPSFPAECWRMPGHIQSSSLYSSRDLPAFCASSSAFSCPAPPNQSPTDGT